MGNTEKFDQMATKYDTAERVFIAEISASAVRDVLGVSRKYTSALDFGCGTGVVGLSLIDLFDRVYFLDTSLNMLNVVDEKLKEIGVSNAETLHIDLEQDNNMDFDFKVDCIFMCQVLLHINDYVPVLDKLKNMLNPNGVLVIVDFDENTEIVSDLVHGGFNQFKLCESLKGLDFSKVESKNFHSGEKLFMNQDATMFVLKAEL